MKRDIAMDGYKPTVRNDGYQPKSATPKPDNGLGGYRPTAGQGRTTPPASVSNQPSSVQPPKK